MSQRGHGCFLLGCGGRSFSNSNQEHNDFQTGLSYGKGDVIKVETNVDELLFFNEIRKWEFKMKIKLTDDEWLQTFFCISLKGKGDSVSIIGD